MIHSTIDLLPLADQRHVAVIISSFLPVLGRVTDVLNIRSLDRPADRSPTAATI